MSDKSLGILAGSLFSILFVFTLIYFGPQTITYVRMRPLLLRTPDAPPRGWGSAPEPLEELEVPTARRFVISWDGYQFEVPRGELKSERGDGMIELEAGHRIRFRQSQVDPINPATLHCSLSDFTKLFGTPLHESKYEQFRENSIGSSVWLVATSIPQGLPTLREASRN